MFVIYKMLTGQNNYVQQRLGAWNGDEGDILYQTQQSLYSIASGGLTGLGIGNSRQKHLWLPEASNDFIFFRSVRRAGLYRRGDLYGPFCRTDHSGRYHRPELAGLFWYDAGYWHYVANCLAGHDPHCGGHQCGPKYWHQPAVFFSSGGTSLLILLCEMGIILSISRAGNAQNAARSKRSHEELARRMNPQRRTHKALHSN